MRISCRLSCEHPHKLTFCRALQGRCARKGYRAAFTRSFSRQGDLSFSAGMLAFDDVPVITSIPLTTVAQLVAGEPFAAPAGGVSSEQLVLPKSSFSYFQPWSLSRSYVLFT